jgi:hypothetical protein
MKLSEAEQTALDTLKVKGGSILTSEIPDTNQKDGYGFSIPGMGVYRKLEIKGLVVICEPLVDDDGFEWTPAVELINLNGAA